MWLLLLRALSGSLLHWRLLAALVSTTGLGVPVEALAAAAVRVRVAVSLRLLLWALWLGFFTERGLSKLRLTKKIARAVQVAVISVVGLAADQATSAPVLNLPWHLPQPWGPYVFLGAAVVQAVIGDKAFSKNPDGSDASEPYQPKE